MFMGAMLLVCPSCRTRYVIPDAAIGAAGRQVRCANCRHSWFQEGPKAVAPPHLDPVASAPESVPVPEQTVNDPPIAEERGAETVSEKKAEPGFSVFERGGDVNTAPPPSVARPVETPAPPSHEGLFSNEPLPERSQFDRDIPFKPRRNPAKLMTYAAFAFAAVVMLAGAALWYSGWLDNSFVSAGKEPDLKIIPNANLEQGKAADGTPYFIASGSIVNPTAKTQRVPDIMVTLKDSTGRAVFNAPLRPPVRSLAPGATADFSKLHRDIPLSATKITFSWTLE